MPPHQDSLLVKVDSDPLTVQSVSNDSHSRDIRMFLGFAIRALPFITSGGRRNVDRSVPREATYLPTYLPTYLTPYLQIAVVSGDMVSSASIILPIFRIASYLYCARRLERN
ncbi:uncharacterized protein RSE6_04951 [Rhynchosporium secalis]|uniref:Uncharacterized protein n=1 Tax=Rhynchosporium secalis TaxID=38038 RepID=A0A1E1M6M3_RHYSE|nr:uncharacterized protein RSE6_04951 [Rhynchosporium secalis]